MAVSPVKREDVGEAPQNSTVVDFPFPAHDVRRKRPPLLSFLLRMDTMRRVGRMVVLLALDVLALFLAIFTALCFKAAVRSHVEWAVAYHQTRHIVTLAALVVRRAAPAGQRAAR